MDPFDIFTRTRKPIPKQGNRVYPIAPDSEVGP